MRARVGGSVVCDDIVPSDGAGEAIAQIRELGAVVARRAQERDPCALLVPDRPELPDTERGFVGLVPQKGGEAGRRVVLFVVNRLPQLVRAAPGTDDQEVELLPAQMQQDEAELAVETESARARFSE